MHPIINEYLEKGYIDKEAAARLTSFEEMTKESSFGDNLKRIWTKLKDTGGDTLKKSLGPLIGTTAGFYLAQKVDQSAKEEFRKKMQQDMQASYTKMFDAIPALGNKDIRKVRERFNQLSAIAPTVASTPEIAAKVIHRTANKGFNEDDVHKLTQIESNYVNISRRPIPKSPFSAIGPAIGDKVVRPLVNAVVDASVIPSFDQQVRDSAARMSGLSEDEIYNSSMWNSTFITNRIKAAVKAGIDVPDQIKNLKAGSGDMASILDALLRTPIGERLFPDIMAKLRQFDADKTKTAQALSSIHCLKQGFEKTAFEIPKSFWTGLMVAAASGLTAGGVDALSRSFARKQRQEKIQQSWDVTQSNLKNMTKSDSQLSRGINYKDPKTQAAAKNVFNTLVTVAPDLAANPEIATSYVNRVVNMGEVDVQAIKTVSDIQKNLDNQAIPGHPLMQSAERGVGTAKTIGEIGRTIGLAK